MHAAEHFDVAAVAAATRARRRARHRARRAAARGGRRRRRRVRPSRRNEPGHHGHRGDVGRRRAPPTLTAERLDDVGDVVVVLASEHGDDADDRAHARPVRPADDVRQRHRPAGATASSRRPPRCARWSPRCRCNSAGRSATAPSYGRAPWTIAAGVAERLGLVVPDGPWSTRAHARSPASPAPGASSAPSSATSPRSSSRSMASDVGELAERADGAGGSSSMAHKHNPVAAISARAAALQVPGLVATLLHAAGGHDFERAAGAWHAEWPALNALLRTRRSRRRLAGDEPPAHRRRPPSGWPPTWRAAETRARDRDRARRRRHRRARRPADRLARVAGQLDGDVGPPGRQRSPLRIAACSSTTPATAPAHRRDGPLSIAGSSAATCSPPSTACGVEPGRTSSACRSARWSRCRSPPTTPHRVGRLALLCTSARFDSPDAVARAGGDRARRRDGAVAETVVGRWLTPDYAAAHPDEVATLVAMIARHRRRELRRLLRGDRRDGPAADACRASPRRRSSSPARRIRRRRRAHGETIAAGITGEPAGASSTPPTSPTGSRPTRSTTSSPPTSTGANDG